MIDSLDQSLSRLLQEKVPLPPGSDVGFDPPSRDWADSRHQLTVNLYLYDVRENHEFRTPIWTDRALPDGTVTRVRPNARIDLSYLVTTWSAGSSRDVLEEHRLLGDVLRTLLRFPTLPAEVLQGEMVGQEPPLPAITAQPDGPANPADVWLALDNRLTPALVLVVTISVPPSAYLDVPTRLVPAVSRSLLVGSGVAAAVRLAVRPVLASSRPADDPVTHAHVDAAVAARLASAVFAAADAITVADGRDLRANTWVVVDDGDDSDFVFVQGPPERGAQTVTADPPLRYRHTAGTAIGRIDLTVPAVTTLVSPAVAGATAVSVASGSGLTDGQWLLLADAERSEFVRLAGPTGAPGPGVLALRRPLAFDHSAGRGLQPARIVASPVTALRDPANQSTASLQLNAVGALTEGTMVMVGSGGRTEFCRLGPVPAGPNPVVPIQPRLRRNHPAGSPLHVVTDANEVGALALAAADRDTDLTVAGEGIARLHPGDVIGLGPLPREYHQVTSTTSEAAGVTRAGEILVQIAGTVTDDADPPEPIPGAAVALVDLLLSATTDGRGRFVFTNLAPSAGTLTLRAAATGYRELTKQVHIPATSREEYLMRLSAA
jgi:hypothetical protein